MQKLYLVVPLAPLAGAIIAGLFGWAIGNEPHRGRSRHDRITCRGIVSTSVRKTPLNGRGYTWLVSGNTSSTLVPDRSPLGP